jgi:glycosyltransferase involved in cell wall biosynthesis
MKKYDDKIKSLCLISRYANYLLQEKSGQRVGGAEFQQVQLAKELVRQGWKVSFITEKLSGHNHSCVDGIDILFGMNYFLKSKIGVRLSLYLQLWKKLKQANADIYYQRNPGIFSALIALFCKCHGKRFVIAGAHDTNFDKGNELNINSFLDRFELTKGLNLADTIITQSHLQSRLLKTNYNRKGVLLHNLYQPPKVNYTSVNVQKTIKANIKILWVGRLAEYKRPHLFLELSTFLPDYDFIIIGANSGNQDLINTFIDKLKNYPNVSYLGHLPLPEVETLFNEVDALVSTSSSEGFPNTFLQAWSRGLPVFSFVDPDDLIKKNNLGVQVESIDQMAKSLRGAFPSGVDTKRIKAFFNSNFAIETNIWKFSNILMGKELKPE